MQLGPFKTNLGQSSSLSLLAVCKRKALTGFVDAKEGNCLCKERYRIEHGFNSYSYLIFRLSNETRLNDSTSFLN